MVDLNKTQKLLKDAHRKLEEQLSEQSIDGGLRKKVISKVKRYVKLETTPLLEEQEDHEDTSYESPPSLLQMSPQVAVATVSSCSPFSYYIY